MATAVKNGSCCLLGVRLTLMSDFVTFTVKPCVIFAWLFDLKVVYGFGKEKECKWQQPGEQGN